MVVLKVEEFPLGRHHDSHDLDARSLALTIGGFRATVNSQNKNTQLR